MNTRQFRISSLTTAGNSILVILTVLLVGSSLWAINALQRPYSQLLKYTDIATRVQTGLRKPMDQYLSTGDALNLTAAENQLTEILQTELSQLPDEAITETLQSAQQLQAFMAGELRAAGKLSGDPQGLLLQAEREMRNALSTVNDYAIEGAENNPRVALDYSYHAARLLEELNNMAHLRQKFFVSRDTGYRQQITDQVAVISDKLQKLRQLPRLGVRLEQELDEFSAMMGIDSEDAESSQEEKVEEPLSSLNYLLGRYNDELVRSEENIAHAAQVDQQARQQLDVFISSLDSVVLGIDSRFKEIASELHIIVIAVAAAFILMMLSVTVLQQRFVRATKNLLPFLSSYASGDLSSETVLGSRFVEAVQLETSSNQLRGELSKLVAQIRHEADNINQLGSKLNLTVGMTYNGAEEQVQHTLQSVTAMNQMSASFNEVASNAAQASDSAQEAEQSGNQGQQVIHGAINIIATLAKDIESTTEIVKTLETESAKIDSVRAVIETIAEQTNLLALNAAIEAARAGEQGRGFAVVADEVRQLSKRTTDSTHEIRDTIEKLQAVSQTAAQTMSGFVVTAQQTSVQAQTAGHSFDDIVNAMTAVRDMTAMIASATEQQAAVADQVDRSVSHIKDMGEQTLDSMQQAVSHNQQLIKMSAELQESVQRFVLPA